METFKLALKSTSNWKKAEVQTANFCWDCEVASIPYKMYDIPAHKIISPTWRVVAMRRPVKEFNEEVRQMKEINKHRLKLLASKNKLKEPGKNYAEGKWTVIGKYKYQFFITNDFKKDSVELIREHQKRGTAERIFSFMKNDFAWKLPPFSNMNENTVFMIAASLANNIFVGMRDMFRKTIPQIKARSRLKEFQSIFIDVACAYIDKTYIFYTEDIEYELLI